MYTPTQTLGTEKWMEITVEDKVKPIMANLCINMQSKTFRKGNHADIFKKISGTGFSFAESLFVF